MRPLRKVSYPYGMLTSETLLSRIRSDDQLAWTRFVRLYGELVYQWCRNAGLQAEDAADVGQSVFQIVSQKILKFDSGRKESGAFRSWLWGITRLEILNHLRTTAKNREVDGGSGMQYIIQQLEDSTAEPVSKSGLSSHDVLVRRALEMLEPEFEPHTWQAFWRMTVNGEKAREIGQELSLIHI